MCAGRLDVRYSVPTAYLMRCSTLKVRSPEAKTLIDKIKADLKKRAELKAQRMLLKEPKKKPKR